MSSGFQPQTPRTQVLSSLKTVFNITHLPLSTTELFNVTETLPREFKKSIEDS